MKVRIVWNGTGGALASNVVDEKDAAAALVELIEECGVVHAGDSFTVESVE